MKRLLFIGALILSMAPLGAFAQSDDIYSNGSDMEKQRSTDDRRYNNNNRSQYQSEYTDENTQDQNTADNNDYNNVSDEGNSEEYIDYNDDYTYASHLRRFNQPFYNMGYYSPYYNPYWYDPFWTDPSWGYNPWMGSGISVGFGLGGPCWSSYWGWNTWYGYPGFSCWGYPAYAGGWFGPYYGGFWNGYYGGLYNGYGGYTGAHTVLYGPRYAANSRYNGLGYRAAYGTTVRPFVSRTSMTGSNRMVSNPNAPVGRSYNNGQINNAQAGRMQRAPSGYTPQSYNSYNGGGRQYNSAPAPMRSAGPAYNTPRASAPSYSAPRMSGPSYSAPRMSGPSYSAPRMSAPAPRSFGGGSNFGGGGGRSFGGGGGGHSMGSFHR